MSNACVANLQTALGRTLSSAEAARLLSDFDAAKTAAENKFGKGFNQLPKQEKAKLIATEINTNRASSLTNIEAQLISSKQIVDLSGDLRTTGGQKLEDISASELASNIDNLLGSTNTRQAFIQRNGSVVTYDTAIEVIRNRFGRTLITGNTKYIEDLLAAYTGKTALSKDAENALMDRMLTTNYLDELFTTINKERVDIGLPPIKNQLDITVSRDDIVSWYLNNGKSVDSAAKAFAADVAPLLKNSADLDLLYRDMYGKRNSLDVTGKPTITLNQLEFKDGASYMNFMRKYGADKNLMEHVNTTLDNNARQIALKRVVGDEDVTATITRKLEIEEANVVDPDLAGIKALKNSLEAYKELSGATGRAYDTNVFDIGLDLIKNWTGFLFLGRAPIKGKATDTLITNIALASRGDFGAMVDYTANAQLNLVRSVDDVSDLYYGLNEYVQGANHYLNRAGEGIITKGLMGLLQRGNRNARALNGKVQAITLQNIFVKGNKRALAKLAERKLFNSRKYPEMINESVSVLTHSTIVKLGVKNVAEVRNLDVNTYNNKMGLNLTDAEFQVVKSDLEFEIDAAIMHQIQALQIDSGGTSVQAQNARLGGNLNSGTRRYGFKILGQFQAYSQNFLLKSPIIRHIAMSKSLIGKALYSAIAAGTFISAGYSNYNVNEVLKSGSEDPEYSDPINDIEAAFEGDDDALERFVKNVISGVSLPLVGVLANAESGGKTTGVAPSISYVASVYRALKGMITDPDDSENNAQLVKALLPINLPGLWDAMLVIREDLGEEN